MTVLGYLTKKTWVASCYEIHKTCLYLKWLIMFVNFCGGQLQVVHMAREDGTEVHTDSYEPQQTSGITLGPSTSCHLFPDTSQMNKLQEITTGSFQVLGIYMSTGKGPWGRFLQADIHRPERVNDNMGLLCLLQTQPGSCLQAMSSF